MTQTGRWALAAISALLVLVFAFLKASDLTSADATPVQAIVGLMQVLGVASAAVISNIAAIPASHRNPAPYVQDWAKPNDA